MIIIERQGDLIRVPVESPYVKHTYGIHVPREGYFKYTIKDIWTGKKFQVEGNVHNWKIELQITVPENEVKK
ncbi:MAG: hypothetical protein ABII22_04670 [Candidatus Micrarchaeota archaeon]